MCEIWLPVVGYEGLYEVSDHGRVRGPKGRVLASCANNTGRPNVVLFKDGVRKNRKPYHLGLPLLHRIGPLLAIERHRVAVTQAGDAQPREFGHRAGEFGRQCRISGIALVASPARVGGVGLVLEAFVGPRPDGHECCHYDDDPMNNHLSNLRWDTRSANSFDAIRNGRHSTASKTRCKRQHDLTPDNVWVSKDGRRFCRACWKVRRDMKKTVKTL